MKKFLLSTFMVILFVFSSGQMLMAKQNLQATGTIRGGVYLDANGDGLCIGEGEAEPIPDIDVAFENGEERIILYTGSNGTYGLPTAGQGVWEVTVQPDPKLWQIISARSQQVQVSEEVGLVQLNVDFCLQPATGGRSQPDSDPQLQAEDIDVYIEEQKKSFTTEGLSPEQALSAISKELFTHPPEPIPDPDVDVIAGEEVDLTTEVDWLAYVNLFREMANLPRLQSDEPLSEGSELHSRYMVLHDEPDVHYEEPEKYLYTPAGDQAAENGNIFSTTELEADYKWGVNFWMSAPFHQVPLLDPELTTIGYGNFNKDVGIFNMSAVMDVRTSGEVSDQPVDYPIYFPAQDSETWIVRHSMYEWPDPLESCPGYVRPVGPSIVLQLGDGSKTPSVYGHRVSMGDILLESCLIYETNYENADPFAQSTGRTILDEQDAIVIMPRLPLEMNKTYLVEVFTDSGTYVWSFMTGPVPED